MVDLDGRDVGQVLELIGFVTDDDFWKANVLSLPKFREKFDQLRLQRGRKNGSRPHRVTLADKADEMERLGASEQLPASAAR